MKWNNSLTTDMHLPRTPLRRPFLSIASRGYSRIANVSIPLIREPFLWIFKFRNLNFPRMYLIIHNMLVTIF